MSKPNIEVNVRKEDKEWILFKINKGNGLWCMNIFFPLKANFQRILDEILPQKTPKLRRASLKLRLHLQKADLCTKAR